jgi:hypothetical protein
MKPLWRFFCLWEVGDFAFSTKQSESTTSSSTELIKPPPPGTASSLHLTLVYLRHKLLDIPALEASRRLKPALIPLVSSGIDLVPDGI